MQGILTFENEQIFSMQCHDIAVALDTMSVANVAPRKKPLFEKFVP